VSEFRCFKLHAAVCTRTGLPLAWTVETARDAEQAHAASLLDLLHSRGFRPESCSDAKRGASK
jgi:hypothetical protein